MPRSSPSCALGSGAVEGLGPEVWRVLSKCHDMRNRTEYEGVLDVDERLVADLISACRKVADTLRRLPPIPDKST